MHSDFSVRLAVIDDAKTVLSFIQKIAEYEKGDVKTESFLHPFLV